MPAHFYVLAYVDGVEHDAHDQTHAIFTATATVLDETGFALTADSDLVAVPFRARAFASTRVGPQGGQFLLGRGLIKAVAHSHAVTVSNGSQIPPSTQLMLDFNSARVVNASLVRPDLESATYFVPPMEVYQAEGVIVEEHEHPTSTNIRYSTFIVRIQNAWNDHDSFLLAFAINSKRTRRARDNVPFIKNGVHVSVSGPVTAAFHELIRTGHRQLPDLVIEADEVEIVRDSVIGIKRESPADQTSVLSHQGGPETQPMAKYARIGTSPC
ncbi:hypothetical protein GGF32_002007 [Allomyces javanicus]|nr:hypothetical protein GGF32_002007 [Allomyces javanicus]